MANHPSAAKRNRQRLTRTSRNRSIRSSVRTVVKQARAAIVAGEDTATEKVRQATSALAIAASKGVVHPKTAARTTARIQSALAKRA
jgi:small subunit ribosomal protein S20